MTEHYFQAESAGNHNLQIIIIFLINLLLFLLVKKCLLEID